MASGVFARGLMMLTVTSTLAAAPAHAVLIPAEVKIEGATPAEAQAHAIWSLRAALNVAALQCQFSPFLATVKNYNDFLRQHSDELASAMRVMTGFYRRTAGAKEGQRSFDQYMTRSYQSFAAFDSQRAFCEQAGVAGREMLPIRKGQLGPVALRTIPELRTSLIPEVVVVGPEVDRNWVTVPQVPTKRR
jgi:hypothetical protein